MKAKSRIPGLYSGEPLEPEIFSGLRQRIVLEGCKWDPQIGDVETLASFALVMKRNVWEGLASQAERLTEESFSAEREILRRPELLTALGLPGKVRKVLEDEGTWHSPKARVMRFDFHYSVEGWRISEANSDVPGGFSEASYFTNLMASHFPKLRTSGDPAAAWCDAMVAETRPGADIALLSAPGYMEDLQVIAFLAVTLRKRGCRTHFAKPEQIQWKEGAAHLSTAWHRGFLDGIVRFFQVEWLSKLPVRCGWENLFRANKTLVTNPVHSIISESKRLPLIWDELDTPLPAWRSLLPETRDARDTPWARDDGWLLKTALCNTGETVSIRQLLKPGEWRRAAFQARIFPNAWVAQRKFESVPLPTPLGLRHTCIGVYTVGGKTAGAYVRLSPKPHIDFAAMDAALLLEDE